MHLALRIMVLHSTTATYIPACRRTTSQLVMKSVFNVRSEALRMLKGQINRCYKTGFDMC